MIVSVASGKGGTCKTTVATNLAVSIGAGVQLLDCDVEEPNAALYLKPELRTRQEVGLLIPKVDFSTCTYCGICAEVCRYNAIAVIGDQALVFSEVQTAADASIEVNGISLTRSSNEIDDAIENVTLNLQDLGTGVELSINPDRDAIKRNGHRVANRPPSPQYLLLH